MTKSIEQLLDELITHQEKKIFQMAQSIVPNITEEDLLQPFDFPKLEQFAPFRYEEGILDGLRSAQSALMFAAKEGSLA